MGPKWFHSLRLFAIISIPSGGRDPAGIYTTDFKGVNHVRVIVSTGLPIVINGGSTMSSRKAWVSQRGDSWYVGWRDPVSGNRRKKSFGKSKMAANAFAKKKTAELVEGIGEKRVASWVELRTAFLEHRKPRRPATVESYRNTLDTFERIIEPKTVEDVQTTTIDRFVATRLDERGKQPGSKTRPTSVNKELRELKAVFRFAVSRDFISKAPNIEFLKVEQSDPSFVSFEEFERIYAACKVATKPELPNISAPSWWQAFLVLAYQTGWRRSEPLKLLWEDVDLESGYAISRAKDNKGGRDERIPLTPIVVDHLEAIRGFTKEVFPWPQSTRSLYPVFQAIQEKAGVSKVCRKNHVCGPTCKYFAFHDLRRGFATENASELSASEVQIIMRHRSYTTTQVYLNMPRQVEERERIVSKIRQPNLRKEDRA